MRLDNKVALITGAASGIGLSCAHVFSCEGAAVALGDIADTQPAAAQIGGASIALSLDVTDESSVNRAVEQVLERFGRIDILVHAAGVQLAKPVTDTSASEWDHVLSVNLKGAFLCGKAAILAMRRSGGGVIVNVASELALVGGRSIAAYCASKGGVVQLTKAMAIDHAEEGVRVNCVCPGPVDTPLLRKIIGAASDPAVEEREILANILLKRLAHPDEIARTILFLASDDASFMTGSVVAVDGGWTAQ